jgi:hypothetical protein
MKKSERYHLAMCAVLNSGSISTEGKLEIIETLMEAKNVAVFTEKSEGSMA